MSGPRRMTWVLMGVVGVLVVGCVVAGGWYFLFLHPFHKIVRAAAEVPGCVGVRISYYQDFNPEPIFATLFFEDGAVFTLTDVSMHDPMGSEVDLYTFGRWKFTQSNDGGAIYFDRKGFIPSRVLPGAGGAIANAQWVHENYFEILRTIELHLAAHSTLIVYPDSTSGDRRGYRMELLEPPPFPDYRQYKDFGEIPETFLLESFPASSP